MFQNFFYGLGGRIFLVFSLLCVLTVSSLTLMQVHSSADLRKKNLAELNQTLRESFDLNIRYQVETAVTMLASLDSLKRMGEIDSSTAWRVGTHMVRAARYGLQSEDRADGYFWADTPEGTNVILFGRTDVEGTNRINLQDVKGNYLVREIIKNGMQPQGGFTNYWFPKKGQQEALPKRGYSLYSKPFNIVVGTGAYTNDIDAIMLSKENELTALNNAVTLRAIVLGVLAFLATALGALFVSNRWIRQPLQSTIVRLRDIAQGEGDLTQRIEIRSKDEIGEMSIWFNHFVEKIQKIIQDIRSQTLTLSSSSEELSHTSIQIAGNAEEMTAQSNTVASATEESTTNLNAIASAAEQMSSAMGTVASAIEEMSTSIQNVEFNCKKESEVTSRASLQAKEARTTMEQLGAAASTIGKVVDVINNIAAQTNLLALNATIEAASAGEAGKGFAVVAGEVKELAKQTSQATQNIREQIEEMQRNTKTAVEAITKIGTVIEEVNNISRGIVHIVSEQSQAVTKIASNVAGVNLGAQEVARNVAESAHGLAEVASTISGVNSASADTARGILQVKQSASDLARLAAYLQGIVGQFKV